MNKDEIMLDEYEEQMQALSASQEELRLIREKSERNEKLTPEEYCKLIGLDEVPTVPVNKRTYALRDLLGQLTKSEMIEKAKNAAKVAKINRGMEKIYALVDRGLQNVTTK